MSETADIKSQGYYLYAIANDLGSFQLDVNGIENEALKSVSVGEISAIISPCSLKKVRAERKNLMAHNNVLKALLKETTAIPMVFGTVADSMEQVRTILDLNQETLSHQLSEVEDCVEMGLQINWDVSNIFNYFLETHPELKTARDRLMPSTHEPSQNAKIELGQLFEWTVNQDRQRHANKVEEGLSPVCSQIKRLGSPRELKEIMRFALLVKKDRVDELENEVLGVAGLFDNNFSFDYNGPWSPHNFVDVDLKFEAVSESL